MRKVFLLAFLFITLSFFIFVGIKKPSNFVEMREKSSKSIVYVPLDERPLNLDYVEEIAHAAGIDLFTPPRNLLPDYKVPANVDALWSWAITQNKGAAILSADALIYGGLISSRSHEVPLDELMKRVENFRLYRKAHPEQKVYVFVTLMRILDADSAAEEPDYYAQYGKKIFRLSSLEDKKNTVGLDAGEEKELTNLRNLIPGDIYSDWLGRREKNLAVTRKLIEMAREGTIDFLILSRDDTSRFGRSRQEYKELLIAAHGLSSDRFISFPGTDEVGLVLVARAALEGKRARIYVSYAPGAGPATVPGYEDVRWTPMSRHKMKNFKLQTDVSIRLYLEIGYLDMACLVSRYGY
ncbi:hypothetical protein MOTE_18600 [Moorella thermoacetica]|uniref:DUF4127 family protein n=1 Tax=Neomoorella thermoacetica TaxID=1525 RepID=A0A1J5NK05_NEOTH|nr:hypothetical protein MOTE_18600 [Moorella thermoacetica]